MRHSSNRRIARSAREVTSLRYSSGRERTWLQAHAGANGLRRDLRRHRARAAIDRRDAAGAAPLRQGPARRRRLRGRPGHRRVRDHRPRLPPARGAARRRPRPQARRDRGQYLDRGGGAPVLRSGRRARPDHRPPLPRRRRGRRLHRGLGVGGRHGAARAPRPDHRPLRARDLGRARARPADRRADPARDRLRGGLGVRRRRAARRRRARAAHPRELRPASRAAGRSPADLARGAAAWPRPDAGDRRLRDDGRLRRPAPRRQRGRPRRRSVRGVRGQRRRHASRGRRAPRPLRIDPVHRRRRAQRSAGCW